MFAHENLFCTLCSLLALAVARADTPVSQVTKACACLLPCVKLVLAMVACSYTTAMKVNAESWLKPPSEHIKLAILDGLTS